MTLTISSMMASISRRVPAGKRICTDPRIPRRLSSPSSRTRRSLMPIVTGFLHEIDRNAERTKHRRDHAGILKRADARVKGKPLVRKGADQTARFVRALANERVEVPRLAQYAAAVSPAAPAPTMRTSYVRSLHSSISWFLVPIASCVFYLRCRPRSFSLSTQG